MRKAIVRDLNSGNREFGETCALDVAECGPSTEREISSHLGIWHSNVLPELHSALEKLSELDPDGLLTALTMADGLTVYGDESP